MTSDESWVKVIKASMWGYAQKESHFRNAELISDEELIDYMRNPGKYQYDFDFFERLISDEDANKRFERLEKEGLQTEHVKAKIQPIFDEFVERLKNAFFPIMQPALAADKIDDLPRELEFKHELIIKGILQIIEFSGTLELSGSFVVTNPDSILTLLLPNREIINVTEREGNTLTFENHKLNEMIDLRKIGYELY